MPHAAAEPRSAQRTWLLDCVRQLWGGFRARFLALWDQHGSKGDAYQAQLFGSGGGEQVCGCCACCATAVHAAPSSWGHIAGRDGLLQGLQPRAAVGSGTALLRSHNPSQSALRHRPQPQAAQQAAQAAFMSDLWRDALGFAGAVIVRRLVGIAHVADMDSIAGGCSEGVCPCLPGNVPKGLAYITHNADMDSNASGLPDCCLLEGVWRACPCGEF